MTVRATIDSNILIYAALEPASAKGLRAAETIRRATPQAVLAAQALLEFVAVVRRRAPALAAQAIAQVESWSAVFEVAPTTTTVMASAMKLMRDHRFQVWDAVIWAAAHAAGARLFLSEDLQDGLVLDGMRVADPFRLSEAELARLLEA